MLGKTEQMQISSFRGNQPVPREGVVSLHPRFCGSSPRRGEGREGAVGPGRLYPRVCVREERLGSSISIDTTFLQASVRP